MCLPWGVAGAHVGVPLQFMQPQLVDWYQTKKGSFCVRIPDICPIFVPRKFLRLC
jgi:hypothetical protein